MFPLDCGLATLVTVPLEGVLMPLTRASRAWYLIVRSDSSFVDDAAGRERATGLLDRGNGGFVVLVR